MWVLLFIALFFCTANINAQKNSYDIFGSIRARHIGPATMSGRISALDAVAEDPRIIYAGAASGGIWKSTNMGTTFKPVFDEYNQCIGSITIDQKHPDTVWVGTGETWVRNSVSIGNGIYKTTDGGKNWQKCGLENTERISKIIIHPDNPDIVYAAALGHLWNENKERGVFKTTDGGKTWENILFINENTGCSDLAMAPGNPDILFAGMWEFRRRPYTFKSGGEGSGFYKSTDGGKSWNELKNDLPEGEKGRIALSASPVKERLIYALIESKKTGLYRSFDYGETWEEMSTGIQVGERPFYFSLIVSDPVDTNRIYKPGFNIYVSDDGGYSFTSPYVEGGNVHSDIHALWISPNDNNLIYAGTDGGLYISHDRGSTWRLIENLPVSQFYHVSVDNKEPYYVYGGLQDNGSWRGPSASPGGIENNDWENIGFGDGFYAYPDPFDENIIYWQWQGGNIVRYYEDTKETKEIKPFSDDMNEALRFNWNTPVYFSPVNKKVMYVGAQYLFKSTDRGDSWEKISPDLTTNDPEKQKQEESGGLTIDNSTAENHCTIYTISESPLSEDVIWAGTDDGNLQVTSDGGENWSKVVGNIPNLPANTWCSFIYAGNRAEETAYAAFDGHRDGDMDVYLFKTTDLGETWTSIATEEIEGFARVIKEDTENPDLLFLGTENGLFVSIDGGGTWNKFTNNMPPVPVYDLVIHPVTSDLVMATHGRGIIIVDDISPLRQLTPQILEMDFRVLESKPYIITNPKTQQAFSGDHKFTGRNPADVAYITYYMKRRHIFGDFEINIYNSKAELVKSLPAGKQRGINRVPWIIRRKPPKVKASSLLLLQRTAYGPAYPPGEYTVEILKGKEIFGTIIKIETDPDSRHSKEDMILQSEVVNKSYDMLEEISGYDNAVVSVSDAAKDRAGKTENVELKEVLLKILLRMQQLHESLVATNPNRLSGESKLAEKIGDVYSAVLNYTGRPTDSQIRRLDVLEKELNKKKEEIEKFLTDELPKINQQLKESNLSEIIVSL